MRKICKRGRVQRAKRGDLIIETMPSRKKPSEREARSSISRSLQEFGLSLDRPSHAAFHRKLSSQVVKQALERHDHTIHIETKTIPSDREEAIEFVYVLELLDYLNKKNFTKKAEKVHDKLEDLLLPSESPVRILHWAPFRTRSGSEVVRKLEFGRFPETTLDPFNRFSLLRLTKSPEQLAFDDFYHMESSLLGYAFEAIVASFAVHNVNCPRCRALKSLSWTGGSETSWRDMHCMTCQSCFEIKSKESKDKIDTVFKFDSLVGGSFRKWCEDDFTDRVKGTDFIVFVSRTPATHGWPVDIAEIGTAFPVAIDRTFAEAHQDRVSTKACLTLKNRQRWFCVPGGDLPDLKEIFRAAYERAFPGRWASVGGPPSTNRANGGLQRTTIDDIAAELERVSIGLWDDSD
jgi:hypothetical protein